MKHKMAITLQLVFCLALIYGNGSMGKPLAPEDVEGLLPPTPHDKNETIAAVVQDPVVQDAVHHTVTNRSLNGLVVKKHVFIMPATNPNLILSKREHLLVVPTENLEDVRKNITEAKKAEAQESSSPENQAFFEDDAREYTPEVEDNNLTWTFHPMRSSSAIGEAYLSDHAEDSSSRKVTVPIVAVIDPSNVEKDKVKSPIVAILPNQVKNGELNSQVEFLKHNSEKIQKKAQDIVDQSSLSVNPDYWKSSTPSEITVALSPYSSVPVSYLDEEAVPSSATNEKFLSPVVVSQWAMLTPSLQDDQMDYSRETGDMDVAEDIIFRPLFRYRQESQQRSKYYDESNRRYSYTPYRDYDNYYPRRYFYRPRNGGY